MTGYDVIIIGTGAGGGMAIKALCEAGLSVCALNAGREIDPKKDFRNHKMPIDLKFRGLGSPSPIFTSRSLRFPRHSRRLSLSASPFERNSAPSEEAAQSFFPVLRKCTVVGFYTSRGGLQSLDYPRFRI